MKGEEGAIPCRKNPTSGTQRDDVRGRHGAQGRTGAVIDAPGQEAGAAGEGAEGDEEDAAVADVGVFGPAQDREARDCQQHEAGEVDAALAGLVADVGDEDSDGAGADVGGDAVELGFGVGPAEVVEDGGLEVVSVGCGRREVCVPWSVRYLGR
jgi:hypothetical protein